MTKDEMKALCREYALRHSNEHAYLPQNITQAKTWEPHLWVLAAIEAAIAEAVAKERREIAEFVDQQYGVMPMAQIVDKIRARGAAHD